MTYQQFLNCCYLSNLYLKEDALRQQLSKIDKDHTGFVAIGQLREILESPQFQYPKDALDKIFSDELQIQLPSDQTFIDYNKFIDKLRDQLKPEWV